MNKKGNVRRGVSLLLALLMLLTVAQAEKLTFPNGLKQIEAEAFMGDNAITSVVLPNSLTTLGARAFADCGKLKAITIPASVTSLGDDIFKGCPSDVLISTTPGSEAMRYAQSHQLDYQAGTKYRALLVGQSYIFSFAVGSWLYGPPNDIKAMKKGLEGFSGTPYSVTSRSNLNAQGILDAIASTFAGATEQDVSLFYYSGHGTESGWLVGYDGIGVDAATLREALDKIPGRKVVIIDACFSGNMIGRDISGAQEGNGGSAGDFVHSFMGAFTVRAKDEDLRGPEYFVITAAKGDESSWEINRRGAFTEGFLRGCGYDYAKDKKGSLHADSNGNKVVTLQEAYAYAYKEALSILGPHRDDEGRPIRQYAQVYPDNCNWFGLFRK